MEALTTCTPGRASDLRRASRVRLGLGPAGRFVDDDHVGAGDLIFEQFRQRRFVVEVFVLRALRVHGGDVVGELAVGARRRPSTTVMTPSTVTRVDMPGQLKARTSGCGRARPEVSITM